MILFVLVVNADELSASVAHYMKFIFAAPGGSGPIIFELKI